MVGIILLILIAVAMPVSAERVTSDLVVFYNFTETSGTVIHDRVTEYEGQYLDLVIPDPTKVEWLNPGLRVNEATLVKTSGDTTKIKTNDFFSKGTTIEVWVKPLNNTQSGPARIVTFSKDTGGRNYTLGQQGDYYQQRFRTSQTNNNGSNINVVSPAGSIATTPVLQHVVYTRDPSGVAKIYIDGVEVGSNTVLGDSSTWDMTYEFGLFNEMTWKTAGDERTWLGDIFLVAIYKNALSHGEVQQNFVDGLAHKPTTGSVTLAWDANTEEDLAGYKICYGLVSRYDSSILPSVADIIIAKCYLPETGELNESQQSCKDSWENYCATTDPRCDRDYYPYDKVVDVKDVNEHTLTDLVKGVKYYLAAVAYDTSGNESKYSVELEHIVKGIGITEVINMRLIRED